MKNIKKVFSLLIIISVIISNFTFVSSAGTNLATASGVTVIKSGAGGQARVNDGNKNTDNSNSAYINSINSTNYIGFDLGSEKSIESVIIYESTTTSKHIGNFVIETATDNSFASITDKVEANGVESTGTTVTFPTAVTARYIRFRPVTYKGTDTSGMVYISEIEVIGSEVTEPTPPPEPIDPPVEPEPSLNTPNDTLNLAKDATFTKGGSASSSNLSRLNDGSKYVASNSYAYNFGSGVDSYVVCNLGSLKVFNTVDIYEYSKSLRLESYELSYSIDGVTYITIANVNGAGSNRGLASHQFEEITAQYIKLTMKNSSGNVYLEEIEVYYKTSVNLPSGSKNYITTKTVDSVTAYYYDRASTPDVTYDGNKNTALKNSSSNNSLRIDITLDTTYPIKALRVTLDNCGSIGNISIKSGNDSSSSREIYKDNLKSNIKIIPVGDESTKYIRVTLSDLTGIAGICEIEGLSDDAVLADYTYSVKESISDYIINQAKYSNNINLPMINSSTWTVSDSSVASVSGSTLSISGENTSFYLTADIDLGNGKFTQFDISVPVGDNLTFVPVIPEVNDAFLIVSANIIPFKDIDTSWANKYIADLYKLKIISGVTPTTFEPERQITRAEFVKLLVESLMVYDSSAASSFEDVAVSEWYSSYVGSLEKIGAAGDVWNNKFNPDAYITREDMAYFTTNALNAKSIVLNKNSSAEFTDYSNISEYAKESVMYLTQIGFVSGNPDGTFNPKGNLTRAEASKIIYFVYNCY